MGLTQKEKKKWVKALRSGRYKAGTEILYNKENNTFCCLGVEAVVNRRAKRGDLESKCFRQDCIIGSKVQEELAELNDGDWHLDVASFLTDEEKIIPWELIAGLVIEPWDGETYEDQ